MWKRIVYFPNDVKTHIIHPDLENVVIQDVRERYSVLPTKIETDAELKLDPGGMVYIKDNAIRQNFDSRTVSVKPEHILAANIRWSSHRKLKETMPSGEAIIKVYLGPYTVVVVPEGMYNEIGSWLALSKAEGYVASAEMRETLEDIPWFIAAPMQTEGDA